MEFCQWYVDQLQNYIRCSTLHLHKNFIPPEHKSLSFYNSNNHLKRILGFLELVRDWVENPQSLLSKEGFDMLLSTLQSDRQKSESISEDSTMVEASDEMLNRDISGIHSHIFFIHTNLEIVLPIAPDDGNKDHTNAEIHALMQSDTLVRHIPKDNLASASASSLDLTKILLQRLELIRGEISIKLKFIHLPKQYWHPRTINCLAKNDCPPLQSALERKYIVLEVRW